MKMKQSLKQVLVYSLLKINLPMCNLNNYNAEISVSYIAYLLCAYCVVRVLCFTRPHSKIA